MLRFNQDFVTIYFAYEQLFFIYKNIVSSLFFKISILQSIKESLGRLQGHVEIINNKKTPALQNVTPKEAANIQEKLTQLNFEWDKVNKMYRERQA